MMAETSTVTLYKSVGLREWVAIQRGGCSSFVRRRPYLPVFYPESSKDRAIFVASEYHTHNGDSGMTGHVLRFEIRPAFLDKCYLQIDPRDGHREYQVWPKDWAEFNANIVGRIEVIATFTAEQADK